MQGTKCWKHLGEQDPLPPWHLHFIRGKQDNEIIQRQDNQVIINAIKRAELGWWEVQGGDCGGVDRESSKELFSISTET